MSIEDELKRQRAEMFVYVIKPLMDRFGNKEICACPMCGEMLQYYRDCGYVHLADGDADCYGVLGTGKG